VYTVSDQTGRRFVSAEGRGRPACWRRTAGSRMAGLGRLGVGSPRRPGIGLPRSVSPTRSRGS